MTDVSKRVRTKAVKAEVWLHLAMAADRWAKEREHDDLTEVGDDPLLLLCVAYDLTTKDLARICRQVAQEAENRALKLGYGDVWIDDDTKEIIG